VRSDKVGSSKSGSRRWWGFSRGNNRSKRVINSIIGGIFAHAMPFG